MRRVVLFTAVVAVVFVPTASAVGNADTRVTLDYLESFDSGGGPTTVWTGDIFSSEIKCKKERRVIVFRVRPGHDGRRGSTLSFKGGAQSGYSWIYQEEGSAPAGEYYAKVRPTDGCNGDRSTTADL